MSDYTWMGGAGAFSSAQQWTVNGSAAQSPPGASDDADFASGGMVTGSGSVAAINAEGATTFSAGTVSTQSVNATAAVTIDSGGNLDSSGTTSFSNGLSVLSGGKLQSDQAAFNGGSVTIDGDGSTYTDQASFQANGTQDFTISDGASVTTGTAGGDLDVIETGSLSVTSGASLTVADLTTFNGTTWSVDQGAVVNALGGGNLSGAGLVGVLFNGSGSIDGATLTTQAGFTVGGQGFEGTNATGEATIDSAADVSAGVLILGDYNGDDGTLTLTGSGTNFTLASSATYTSVPGTALIGNDGTGTLVVQDGAVLDETCGPGGFASISYASDGTGEATVDGDGSWQISGTLNVGDGGTGTLSVSNHGSVSVTTLNVSAQSTSGTDSDPSVLTVDGTGSVMLVDDDATIDTATPTATNDSGQPNGMCGDWAYEASGVGQIVAADGGYVSIGGTLTLQTAGTEGAPDTVSVLSGGSVEVGGRGRGAADTFVVDAAGLVIGHGTIAVDDDGSGASPGGTLANDGTVEASDGTLELDANLSGAGSYTIDSNATLRVGGAVAEDSVVTFGGSGAHKTKLMLDEANHFAGSIAQFQSGDIIDLPFVSGIASSQFISATFTDGSLNLRGVGSFSISGASLEAIPTFALAADGNGGTEIGTTPLKTLLDLAFNAYGTPAATDGYIVFMTSKQDAGFFAVAYDDPNSCDGNIVIAFRGTALDIPAIQAGSIGALTAAIKNILADTSFPAGTPNALLTRYAADAAQFTAQVVTAARAQFAAPLITLTGHSLGGALAQMVGEAGSFAAAAFDAPGSGQFYAQLSGQLSPVSGLGAGGTNINYRVSGDQVSEAGTPIGQTVTLVSPYTSDTASLGDVINHFLDNHGVGTGGYQTAFGGLATPGDYEPGYAGPDDISLLQAGVQSSAGIVFSFLVAAGVASAFDPSGGSLFTLTDSAASPTLSSIELPFIPGVGSYEVAVESGGVLSAFTTLDAGTIDPLPVGTDGIEFMPLDTLGAQTTISAAFDFTASFASSGQFDGTLTDSGAVAIGQPVVMSASDTVEASGSAAPIGITAPTDAAYADATDLSVLATELPTNGAVYLADGTTAVTVDEELTAAQLAGLTFAANVNLPGAVSSFDYAVTDPDLSTADGSIGLQIACFAAGTRIATARGEIDVRELRVGDRVVRARDRRATRVIRWIGQRTFDCSRHPNPRDVWPVRVCARAFASGRPHRDLLLSPDHAVFVGGALVPIRYLLNGASIVQEPARRVSYWHIELDRHDTLLAENLACESYLDTGNRGAFEDGAAPLHLHPDFALRIWANDACAPLLRDGPALSRVRARLLNRATSLGHRLACDPDIHLLADGVRIEPSAGAGGARRFTLRERTRELRLISRSAVPAEILRDGCDGRRLGVMVGRIAVFRPWQWQTLPMSDLPEGHGFHALERQGGKSWRWTDGDARLPIPPDAAEHGVMCVEIDILAAQPAWREVMRRRARV